MANGSRSGSVRSGATPLSGRKNFPPVPRLQIPPPPPPEAVYTEPGTYAEPYRAMRYSPYYGYGPVLSEIEDGLMKQSLMSGNCLLFWRGFVKKKWKREKC